MTSVLIGMGLFQSTLLRKERLSAHGVHHGWIQSFNPRSYERSDALNESIRKVAEVSIHAPTKGATSYAYFFAPSVRFQSTLLRKERLHRLVRGLLQHGFNPRSYERSDLSQHIHLGCMAVSIHAPTKGATRKRNIAISSRQVSIHAPTKGATAVAYIRYCHLIVSIHAPTKGATFDNSSQSGYRPVSIHAPTKGATDQRKS